MTGGSSPDRGWELFSSPLHPDLLWGPPSLLFNGYQELCHPVQRSRIRGAIPLLPNTPSWRGAQLKHKDNLLLQHIKNVFVTNICTQSPPKAAAAPTVMASGRVAIGPLIKHRKDKKK
jgi:hypothetical protein